MTFFEVLEKHGWLEEYERNIQTAIQSAILAEREECATKCDQRRANLLKTIGHYDPDTQREISIASNEAGFCAHVIRARSQSAPQLDRPIVPILPNSFVLPFDLPKPGQILGWIDPPSLAIPPVTITEQYSGRQHFSDAPQASNQPQESRFKTEADLLDGLFEKKL